MLLLSILFIIKIALYPIPVDHDHVDVLLLPTVLVILISIIHSSTTDLAYECSFSPIASTFSTYKLPSSISSYLQKEHNLTLLTY